MAANGWWPLLVVIPAAALYFYFKLTVKDLMGNWAALIKDGLASGAAFLLTGICFFFGYSEGVLHWAGLGLALWSLTYWGSALISYRNLQTEKVTGRRVSGPFERSPSPGQVRPNRSQRRTRKRQR